MADNVIGLEFPDRALVIDVGVTLTFDNISGYLPISRTEGNLPTNRLEGTIPMSSITGDLAVDRLTGVSGLMTESEAHDIWDNA